MRRALQLSGAALLLPLLAVAGDANSRHPTPVGCEVALDPAVKPDDFYPPGPRRRRESGRVTVSFFMNGEAGAPSDVEITVSSGYPDLDQAALNLARTNKRTNCAGQRYTSTIEFVLGDPVHSGHTTFVESRVIFR
jgi:TonB family protein